MKGCVPHEASSTSAAAAEAAGAAVTGLQGQLRWDRHPFGSMMLAPTSQEISLYGHQPLSTGNGETTGLESYQQQQAGCRAKGIACATLSAEFRASGFLVQGTAPCGVLQGCLVVVTKKQHPTQHLQ